MSILSRQSSVYVGSVAVAFLALFGGEAGGFAVLLWAIICTIGVYATRRAHVGDMRQLTTKVFWAFLLMSVGFVVRGVHGEIAGIESPIPSPADFLHIPAYLFFFAATIQVHRKRAPRPNPDAWLDAGAVVVSLIIVLWVTFFADYLVAENLSVATRAVNGVYNLIILAAFTVFVRITATPGNRSPAYYLLGAAAFSYFIVDLAASYSLVRNQGLFLTIALSPVVFGLTLASLRHREAAFLLDEDTKSEVRVGPLRLSILAAAISAPLLVAVFGRNQPAWSVAFLLAASVSLSVFVIARVVRLLRSQRDAALLERRLANHVGLLGTLDSKEAIAEQLLAAADDILPSSANDVRYTNDTREEKTSFALPASLKSDGRNYLAADVNVATLEPANERVLKTLLRDTGLIASALDGLKAVERARNEKETNERIAAREARFRALVENSTDTVFVLDPAGNVKDLSGAVFQILEVEPEELIGTPLVSYFHQDDTENFNGALAEVVASEVASRSAFKLRTPSGEPKMVEVVLTNMTQVPEVGGIVVNANDITQRRRLEHDLNDAKVTDGLTSLPNRFGFAEQLEITVRRAALTDSPLALAAIDIKAFDATKDALGPRVADDLLTEVARKLRKVVRSEDTVARLGGHEFGILLQDAPNPDSAINSITRIVEAISVPEAASGQGIHIKWNVGIAHNTDTNIDATDLLREADIALTAARESDDAKPVLFEPEMAMKATERLELKSSLERGLDEGQFRLVYQPVTNIAHGRIDSVEALARWTHPHLGFVSPMTFIPLAESSGLIDKLGEWALDSACEQLARWHDAGFDHLKVGVNVSVHQLHQPGLIANFKAIPNRHNVDPTDVTIEITESVLIDDSNTIAERLRELRQIGFRLAIDDFGTGYSSLHRLHHIDFDILKIDKSFVDQLLDTNHKDSTFIVRSIIELAQGMGAVTIAEGVEEQSQLDTLTELGCDHVQGYLLHKPQEVGDLTPILSENLQAARL